MKYEAVLSSTRVEFVEADSAETALAEVQKLCEDQEAPIYVREHASEKTVWTMMSLIRKI